MSSVKCRCCGLDTPLEDAYACRGWMGGFACRTCFWQSARLGGMVTVVLAVTVLLLWLTSTVRERRQTAEVRAPVSTAAAVFPKPSSVTFGDGQVTTTVRRELEGISLAEAGPPTADWGKFLLAPLDDQAMATVDLPLAVLRDPRTTGQLAQAPGHQVCIVVGKWPSQTVILQNPTAKASR